ncbi:hypothetical protein SK128_003203 [Halocaridina rubra]|uniref:Cupin-like domain-containing protein n=1 Tax=Halocaridina rubra TaxID=373956 RepID=A0AAN8XGN4_HALRR
MHVVGYKYIRLYGEDQTEYLYPHPDPLLNNTSQVNVEGPENPSQPLLKKAQYQDLILGPGEAVYIPPRCWHYCWSKKSGDVLQGHGMSGNLIKGNSIRVDCMLYTNLKTPCIKYPC